MRLAAPGLAITVVLLALVVRATGETDVALGSPLLEGREISALPSVQNPANEGLPSRWFATVQWSYTDAISTMEAFAKATFVLDKVWRTGGGRRTSNTYYYLPTGTLRARYSHEEGGCSWKAQGTVAIKPEHGTLSIRVIKEPGEKTYVEYGDEFAPHSTPQDPTIPETIACETKRSSVRHIHWLEIPGNSRATTSAKKLERTIDYPGGSQKLGFRKWCFTRRQADLEDCSAEELQAVARVSGATVRVGSRTLDGSQSTGDVKGYEWTFDPASCTSTKPGACAGYCKAVAPKPGAKKSGERVTIKPLCTIRAELTVTDGKDEDSDSVLVRVQPRGGNTWKTPLAYRAIRSRMTLPWVKCDSTGACLLDLLGGQNTPDPASCPGRTSTGSQIICPLRNDAATWNGKGYRLATVADTNGPFDGYSYVASSTLKVNMLGVLNLYLFPEAVTEIDGNNFYSYNKKQRANVDGFLEALAQHEGFGAPGKQRTGHAQVVRDDLAKKENDPRREIEQLFAPTAPAVQQMADKRLEELDRFLNSDTCDKGPGCRPLNEIGKFDLYFFHPTGTSYSWDKTTITVT